MARHEVYPDNDPQYDGHPFAAPKTVHTVEDELMDAGYKIASRPTGGEPVWKHKATGLLMTQSKALEKVRGEPCS